MAVDYLSLVAASGSDGGLGKIGTVPASGSLIVRCPAGPNIERIDWFLKSNKASTYQFARSRLLAPANTLTLASVGDGETMILNGLTLTGETTPADALASARKYLVGGTDAAAATALAALINDASYGVPGILASAASAVVSIAPKAQGGAYTLQAVTGTAGAKITVASTTLAGIRPQGGAVAVAANTTMAAQSFEQWVDGWEHAYLIVGNADTGNAATVTVEAVRYRYRD